MKNLKQLQQDFQHALTSTDVGEIQQDIKSFGDLSNQARLNIYSNNHLFTLLKALKAVYPVGEKLVGVEFFEAMAKCYIQDHASFSKNLIDYGQGFADFISEFPPAESLPYLADIARLEWARHVAYYAKTATSLDLLQLQNLPENLQAKIIFDLSASVTLLQSAYPVLAIWEANQTDQVDAVIDLKAGGDYLIVWAKDHEIYQARLSQALWQVLKAIQNRWPFGLLCENLTHEGLDVLSLLPQCLPYLGGFRCEA